MEGVQQKIHARSETSYHRFPQILEKRANRWPVDHHSPLLMCFADALKQKFKQIYFIFSVI